MCDFDLSKEGESFVAGSAAGKIHVLKDQAYGAVIQLVEYAVRRCNPTGNVPRLFKEEAKGSDDGRIIVYDENWAVHTFR